MSKSTIVFLFSLMLIFLVVKVEERNSYIALLKVEQSLANLSIQYQSIKDGEL